MSRFTFLAAITALGLLTGASALAGLNFGSNSKLTKSEQDVINHVLRNQCNSYSILSFTTTDAEEVKKIDSDGIYEYHYTIQGIYQYPDNRIEKVVIRAVRNNWESSDFEPLKLAVTQIDVSGSFHLRCSGIQIVSGTIW